jgi:hypothetical protein
MKSGENSLATPTTAQSLGALLKSACGIIRNDKGLNGGLQRVLDDLVARGRSYRS